MRRLNSKLLLFFCCLILATALIPFSISLQDNYSLNFDGTDDYVYMGQSQIFKLQNLTIEAWIKLKYNIQLGSDSIYGHRYGVVASRFSDDVTYLGTGGWLLQFDYSTGQLSFNWKYNSFYNFEYKGYSANKAVWYNSSWHHIAVTFDSTLPNNNLKIYINGTLDSQHSDSTAIRYTNSPFQIGSFASSSYAGLIDEVRVWNSSRTQTEIQSTISRILSNTEAGNPNLIGYWRFDEGTGTNSKDYSQYGNDAVLASSPANPQWISEGSPILYDLSFFQLTTTTTVGGTTNPRPGNYTHVNGTTVKVQAVPNTGYILGNWILDGASVGSANPISVLMNANHTLQAVFSATTLPSGLVGYWKFDEGAGKTAADSSGMNHTGTLNGPIWADGIDNKALSFNGVNNYVDLPENLIRDSVTLSISTWFETPSHGVIIGYQNTEYPTAPGYYVPIIYVGTDGKLRGEFWTGVNSPITTTFTVNDGNWHYAALVGSTNTQSLYVDGNLVGTLSGAIQHLGMSKNYIGVSHWVDWPSSSGTWGFFNGKIDEVKIYNRALSQEEIQTDMDSLNLGLVGYWKFDEGAGALVYDSSGNTNGTLYNGPTRIDGKYGEALSFDGVDDYVEVNDSNTDLDPHTSDWTISAWVNIAKLTGPGIYRQSGYGFVIVGKRQALADSSLTLLVHSGTSETSEAKFAFVFDGDLQAAGAESALMNVFGWHYVAGVRRGGQLYVYVDGVEYGPNNFLFVGSHISLTTDVNSATPVHLGHHGVFGQYYNGIIDEVRIYSRALTQQEIQADMGQLGGTSSNNGGIVLPLPVLPWPLGLILYGSMAIAAVSLGGLATRRVYRRRRIAKRTEWSKEMAKVEDLRREGEFAKVAKLCLNAFLKSLKRKSEDEAAYSIQRYSDAARTVICQAVLKNDKKALESVNEMQRALGKNKTAAKTHYAGRISEIDSLLEKSRNNDLDFIIDVAATDDVIVESFSKILDAQDEMEVKEIAQQMGYALETTQKLLSKSIKRNKISGFLTLDGLKFMARDSLKTKLKAEIDEGLDD